MTPNVPRPAATPKIWVYAMLSAVAAVMCLPVGVIGVAMGAFAYWKARREPQRYAGGWLALAAIVVSVGGLLLWPWVWYPALQRTAISAGRDTVTIHLKKIGEELARYADAHSGDYPPDLSVLVKEQGLELRYLQSPFVPRGQTPVVFYYVTGLRKDDPPNWVVAYDDLADHEGAGACILTRDGRARFVPEPNFTLEIASFRQAYEQARGSPPIIAPRQ